MAKKALGRGLDALINESMGESAEETEVPTIAVRMIEAGRHQPRKHFDKSRIDELAESIRQNGLIQPIVVAKRGDGYEVIVGERRLRAAKVAGLREIPAYIKDLSGQQALELALIENIQREDLNPIDEALAFRRLQDEFGLTQEEIATRMGRSRVAIANAVRLLQLPADMLNDVSRGTLTPGHARALLSVEEEEA